MNILTQNIQSLIAAAAREDESLGMRTGKESTKKQSFKDRRDESYGAWGKRKAGKVNK